MRKLALRENTIVTNKSGNRANSNKKDHRSDQRRVSGDS